MNSILRHITGVEAYLLYWEQIYQCRPRLSAIKAIDLNLEIITDSKLNILAYRRDLPDDMMWMVINAGHWRIVDEAHLRPEVLSGARKLMIGLKSGLCQN